MTTRRYDQYCPVAEALDIVGERWAMLLVRELLSGPKRFADLETGLPGIGTNTLATRLMEMEAAGVIQKQRLAAPAPATVYALTEWGAELGPILYAIARWGAPRLGTTPVKYPLRATWLATALQAFYRREAVAKLSATIELELPTGRLTLRFNRGALAVTAAAADAPDLRIATGEEEFIGLLTGATPAARAKKAMRLEGDAGLLDVLVAAFPLAPA